MNATRPKLLFWCQHSLGLGHLVRSLALADGFRHSFDVTLLNGGPMPESTTLPPTVAVINLPPLGHDDGYELISRDIAYSPEQAMAHRRAAIMHAYERVRPDVVVIELFPFGRKKFADELIPLLDAIHATPPTYPRAQVVCSLRDILVGQRRDQARHDDRAAITANRYFDLILVHSDSRFARLEESFRPATPLTVPVVHTGFVTQDDRRPQRGDRKPRVIVSAGGGIVGGPLFQRAAASATALYRETGLTTTIVAGPFLPVDEYESLVAMAQQIQALTVIRHVSDLCGEIQRSSVSVSQCGYNTAMDLLRADTPALVVPYAEGKEDEQRRRAERLQRLGLVDVLDATQLHDIDGDNAETTWVARIAALRSRRPAQARLRLDGRLASAAAVKALLSNTQLSNPTTIHTTLQGATA